MLLIYPKIVNFLSTFWQNLKQCNSPFKECEIFSTQYENILKEFGGTWNHVDFCDAFVNAVNKLPVKYTGLGTCLSVYILFTPDIQKQ